MILDVVHFSKLATVKYSFTIEMDTRRNFRLYWKASHSVPRGVENSIYSTMKRGLWQTTIENETEYSILCGLPIVYNSTTRFCSCLNIRIIIRFQAITGAAENARSQLWVNSLFYGTTVVVYGHQRHHQCTVCFTTADASSQSFGLGGLIRTSAAPIAF